MQAWVDHFRAGARDFADVLEHGDLGAPVPSCPEWDLGGLGEHIGGVHQWASYAVTHGSPDAEVESAPTDRRALAEWYRGHADKLAQVLESTAPDKPVWAFGPKPRVAAFWARRQMHEVDMHLWDAKASQGERHSIDRERALDGLDEVEGMFFPRQVRLGRTPKPEYRVELVDVDGRKFVFGESDSGEAQAVVQGPADALLLLVWKRIGLEDAQLRVTGDEEAARSVLSLALTP